ncbi:MAG TPA: pyridoxal-phosphate dependent enzyme [Solirubrobacterales bacterium]
MTTEPTTWKPSLEELEAIWRASADTAKRTPVFSFGVLDRRCGGKAAIKAENLQRTGAFKIRGALAKLRSEEAQGCNGVVAASAGNHGQGLAYAARALGMRCVVFMPLGAAVSKLDAVAAFGAEVRQVGLAVDESIDAARGLAEEEDLLFVHPFEDLTIIKGQAGVGLELMDQIDDIAQVMVPIGGGGLICGIAAALRAAGSKARIIGIQAEACAPFAASFDAGEQRSVASAATIADGIAVKTPGKLNLELASRWVDEVVAVDEDAIAEAMVLLAERGKLVVEGAGAAGVAALLSGRAKPASSGTTAIVLSGGNVDARVFAAVINRHQTGIGRRTRLFTRIDDRPGSLAGLLQVVADHGGNVIDLTHVRDGVSLGLGESGVELVIESRNGRHGADVLARVREAGYSVVQLG